LNGFPPPSFYPLFLYETDSPCSLPFVFLFFFFFAFGALRAFTVFFLTPTDMGTFTVVNPPGGRSFAFLPLPPFRSFPQPSPPWCSLPPFQSGHLSSMDCHFNFVTPLPFPQIFFFSGTSFIYYEEWVLSLSFTNLHVSPLLRFCVVFFFRKMNPVVLASLCVEQPFPGVLLINPTEGPPLPATFFVSVASSSTLERCQCLQLEAVVVFFFLEISAGGPVLSCDPSSLKTNLFRGSFLAVRRAVPETLPSGPWLTREPISAGLLDFLQSP